MGECGSHDEAGLRSSGVVSKRPEGEVGRTGNMGLLNRLRGAKAPMPRNPEALQVALMAMQLDAFFQCMAGLIPFDQRFRDFFELLVNTVCGHNTFAVMRQLAAYEQIREDELGAAEPWAGPGLFFATMRLDEAWNGEATVLRAPLFVKAVTATWEHSTSLAAQRAIPLPPREDWQAVTATIASALEAFRRPRHKGLQAPGCRIA
jgi:hypothetical protein